MQPNCGAAGQQAVLMAFPKPRRHHHGHEPGRRRAPDARHGAEHVGQVVQRECYGLNDKEEIDYDAMEAKARETSPN